MATKAATTAVTPAILPTASVKPVTHNEKGTIQQ
jgi:hypothetical protein